MKSDYQIKQNEIPQVPRFSGFRNIFRFIKNPIPFLLGFTEKYGKTYTFYLGGMIKSVLTIDPELAILTLQKNHKNFEKSYFQTEMLAEYIGHGLLTASGNYWLQQRRLIQPGFHKERLTQVAELMLEEIQLFIKELVKKKGKHDLNVTMSDLAFRIVSKTLFSTDTAAHNLHELKTIVTEVQTYIIRRERQPYFKWYFQVSGKEKAARIKALRAQSILLDYINDRRSSGEMKNDLLDMLLSSKYEDGSGMTDKQLIEETIILFVAGHETTANALTWLFYAINDYPKIREKLRKESASIETVNLFERLSALEYTEQVLKESMRLYPPVWIMDRVTKNEENFGSNTFPANTMILSLIYGIHRDPDFWENPETFIPERFSPENEKEIPNNRYLPFGAGPRFCIGSNFAMMEMKLFLSEWISNIDYKVLTKNVGLNPLVTLRPDRPIIFEIL